MGLNSVLGQSSSLSLSSSSSCPVVVLSYVRGGGWVVRSLWYSFHLHISRTQFVDGWIRKRNRERVAQLHCICGNVCLVVYFLPLFRELCTYTVTCYCFYCSAPVKTPLVMMTTGHPQLHTSYYHPHHGTTACAQLQSLTVSGKIFYFGVIRGGSKSGGGGVGCLVVGSGVEFQRGDIGTWRVFNINVHAAVKK